MYRTRSLQTNRRFYRRFYIPLKVLFEGRYVPATYLFLEALSKLGLLVMVSMQSIAYGPKGMDPASHYFHETLLLIMFVSQLLYKVGQFKSSGCSIASHFNEFSRMLECFCDGLILLWAICIHHRRTFFLTHTALSVSTIPLSLQLLPYISQFRPFGILESIIRQTVQDVYLFAAIYVVWISGFSVFFHSTFKSTSPLPLLSDSDGDQFTSTVSTALYLFKSTLGQIDFSVFDVYSEYTLYGIMVYVAFIMLTTVLLLNLLIAQINNTFIIMQNNASENYAFDRVSDAFSPQLITYKH